MKHHNIDIVGYIVAFDFIGRKIKYHESFRLSSNCFLFHMNQRNAVRTAKTDTGEWEKTEAIMIIIHS